MTTYSDGMDAWQFEQHINHLIVMDKCRLSRLAEARDFDPDLFRSVLDHLVALEHCRRHALSKDEALTVEAEAGYRIVNNHLAGGV